MEGGARSIVMEVAEWNDKRKAWTAVAGVPQMSAASASRQVTELAWRAQLEHAQSIVRHIAEYVAKYDPDVKDEKVVDSDTLKDKIGQFTCHQDAWTLEKIELISKTPLKLNIKLKLNASAEEQLFTKPVGGSGMMLFDKDPNLAVWGTLERNENYVIRKTNEILAKLEDFSKVIDSTLPHPSSVDPAQFRGRFREVVPQLIELTHALESTRGSFEKLGLSNQVQHIASLGDENAARQLVDDLNQFASPPVPDQEVQDACARVEPNPPYASVLYDSSTTSLYVGDLSRSVESWPKLLRETADVDNGGKISIKTDRAKLMPIMETSKQMNDDDIGMFRRFPFPIIRTEVSGRENGTGVEAIISLEKGDSK